MQSILVIISVLISTGLCLAGQQSGNDIAIAPEPGYAVQHVLDVAQQEYKKGNKEKAEKVLREFIIEDPEKDHYLIRFMLGNLLAEKGENEEAISQFNLSTMLYPSYASTWLNLGKLYYEDELFERAADCLLKGYRLSAPPRDHTIKYQAAVCHLLAKNYPDAIVSLEELTALPDPEPRWVETLIAAYLENKMAPKALSAIERLTDRGQNQSYLWKLRAQVLLEMKDYEAALQAFLIYSYGKELDAEESMLVGNLFNVINAPSAAAEYYLLSMNLSKNQINISNAERLALTYLTAHESEKALDFLEKVLREIPSAGLWLLQGKILYDQGAFFDAGQAFRNSAELDPMDGQSILMLAYCLIKLEDKNATVDTLIRAKDFPKYGETADKLLDNLELIWKQ